MRARDFSRTLFVFSISACGAGGEHAAAPPANTAVPPPSAAPAPTAPKREQFQTTLADVGLDATALDRSVDPCEDFHRFACGTWMTKTEIPADKSRWSRSFSVINDRNEADLKKILADMDKAAEAKGDARAKKLGNYWAACLDEAAVEKRGTV